MLESFVGSLDKDAHDETTHANNFIGNKINAFSQYINFFSSVNVNDVEDEFDTYLVQN